MRTLPMAASVILTPKGVHAELPTAIICLGLLLDIGSFEVVMSLIHTYDTLNPHSSCRRPTAEYRLESIILNFEQY